MPLCDFPYEVLDGYSNEEVPLYPVEKFADALRFATPAAGGWIKRTPTVNFDGNKVSCDVEYWHADDWSEILYEKVA